MNLYWLSEDLILSQVWEEKRLSEDVFEEKREKIRERIKLINWQDKPHDKVNINTAAAQINTYIALSYADELKVSFVSRNVADTEVADNLTALASFDFEEMRLDELNYQKQFDKWFYGVAIETFDPFDTVRNCPKPTLQDPLSWYADPYPRWFSAQDFRFHWFEYRTTIEELESAGDFENLEDIGKHLSENEQRNSDEYKKAAWMYTSSDEIRRKSFTIYYHYTKFNGRPYLVVTNEGLSAILKFVQIPAVLKEEKENDRNIPFPIVLEYFRPKRGNPFGDSIMDYVEDKQRAESKLFNLQLIKATREALWGDFLYDSNKIKNRAELTTPTTNKRYIPVNLNPNESIANAISPIPQERLSVDVENMRQLLKRESGLSTGIDQVIQWVRSDKSITARESQTVQQNANLNLALNNKVASWAEKEFWKLWFREYQENFDDAQEKVIRLSRGFGQKVVTFKKDDFTTSNMIDVVIMNRSDDDARKEKEKLNIPYYIQEINNPATEPITKLFLQRKVARLMDMPQHEIDYLYKETLDEKKAKREVELINNGIVPKSMSPEEDQGTFLMYYERCIRNDALEEARNKRELWYEQQLQQRRQIQQAGGEQPGQNQMLNQMTQNSMQQQRVWNESSSLQEIAQ